MKHKKHKPQKIKSKPVKLKDVTQHNWEEVVELEVTDEQEDFLADNAYSLAESKFNRYCYPRAIYLGKEVVGFLMYESMESEGKPCEYSICRFMVDEDHQGKGIGTQALQLLLDEIKSYPNCRRITIDYVPENTKAKAFYARFGFKEIGINEDGEMVAEIRVH